MNMYGYVGNDPVNNTDPSGQVAFWIVNLVKGGVKKVQKVSFKDAVRARRQEKNILASQRQGSGKVERAAADNPNDVLQHKGHKLKDGSGATGRPHFRNTKRGGHTFWSLIGAAAVALFDTSDALACADIDCDGNGIADSDEYSDQQPLTDEVFVSQPSLLMQQLLSLTVENDEDEDEDEEKKNCTGSRIKRTEC